MGTLSYPPIVNQRSVCGDVQRWCLRPDANSIAAWAMKRGCRFCSLVRKLHERTVVFSNTAPGGWCAPTVVSFNRASRNQVSQKTLLAAPSMLAAAASARYDSKGRSLKAKPCGNDMNSANGCPAPWAAARRAASAHTVAACQRSSGVVDARRNGDQAGTHHAISG